MKPLITHERLHSVIGYCQVTGVFTWLVNKSRTAPAGSRAGNINKNGYRHIIIDGKEYKAYRLAIFWVTGKWPPDHVDHENGVTTDDRYQNLRPATRSQNIANSRLRRDNKSGFKGVTIERSTGKWKANINKDGRRHYLGLYESPEAAHATYVAAAANLHGRFARAE